MPQKSRIIPGMGAIAPKEEADAKAAIAANELAKMKEEDDAKAAIAATAGAADITDSKQDGQDAG
jgi:hypothetical protein